MQHEQHIEKSLGAIAGSIKLTRVQKVPERSASEKLALPNGTMLIPGDNVDDQECGRCRFTDSDAAHLVSHLAAISLAYKEGHNLVLILEDDIIIDEAGLACGWSSVENAPGDWQILQVSTRDELGMNHSHKLSDAWISWMPDHRGTDSYFINRLGMLNVLQRAHSVQGIQTTSSSPTLDLGTSSAWSVREPCMLISDELLYYSAN